MQSQTADTVINRVKMEGGLAGSQGNEDTEMNTSEHTDRGNSRMAPHHYWCYVILYTSNYTNY